MNKQETFDFVLAHLRKQGKQAVGEDKKCRYRTDDGLMCAAGCLIKDEYFEPSLNTENIKKRDARKILESSGYEVWGNRNWTSLGRIICAMQSVHDTYDSTETDLSFMEHVESGFKAIAKTYDLVYKEAEPIGD